MSKRIAFVHTVGFLVEEFRTRMSADIPTADCFHILNESLLQDLLRGAPQALVYRRVVDQIVLAAETVRAESVLESKSFDHHLTHLVVHGLLHLLGYDHETDDDAEEMEALERRILARLAIADPYAVTDEA